MNGLSHVRIVLVGTTHPGNIGAVARAMLNMTLQRLYLVRPKSFPHEDATARAAGAGALLAQAVVCDDLASAIADCTLVIGASVRARSIELPPLDPAACAERVLDHVGRGDVALVFGPEHSGLSNADLDLCQQRVFIPSNPEFASLNLAAAVQVLAYELYRHADRASPAQKSASPPATREQLEHFFSHLERVLAQVRFLRMSNPERGMRRLRALVNRAAPDQNEVQMLRGILSATEHALAAAEVKASSNA
ncbi:MAG: tRNA (cytosine(32)/uridine(32)-2'-O)-methyltransferase TrmJ [Immundisolibacter sp.]